MGSVDWLQVTSCRLQVLRLSAFDIQHAFFQRSPTILPLPQGDLSRLGNGERNSAKPKARQGRASGRERVSAGVRVSKTKQEDGERCPKFNVQHRTLNSQLSLFSPLTPVHSF